ncbi:MAG: DNA polymerase V [Flavobacteriales bacterium]|jgi:DNA polymerase V
MSVIALIDANNFFCTAHAAYDLALRDKPLVIAGSNDGMIIARSAEAKALGIKMAEPYFKVKHLERTHGLISRSANYALITDLSQRVSDVLDELVPLASKYSIDESFLLYDGLEHKDLTAYSQMIRQSVLQWTGVKCCVGIAANKTLAKAANNGAKKYPACNGVVDLYSDPLRREKLLAITPVGDIWGVGKVGAAKLNMSGIVTALDLALIEPDKVKKNFGVGLYRTGLELRGEQVFPFEEDATTNKSVIASRSLGRSILDPDTLKASISHHIERAVRKLRAQDSVAAQLSVTIQTNMFKSDGPRYSKTSSRTIAVPTSDFRVLGALANEIFSEVFRQGYEYTKTGIAINKIIPRNEVQPDLFSEPTDEVEKKEQLMGAIDTINQKYGVGTLTSAAQKRGESWQPKSENKTPSYTTKWSDIPVAHA